MLGIDLNVLVELSPTLKAKVHLLMIEELTL